MRPTVLCTCPAACVLAGFLAGIAPTPCASAGGTPNKQAALQNAWYDLASDDPACVARAAIVIGRSPVDGVAFLKEHCRPVKADAALLQRWLANLDAEESSTRAAAQEELEYLGKYIKNDLQKALKSGASAEARKRIEQLLDRIAADEKQANPPAAKLGLPGKGRSIGVRNINGQIQVIVDGVPLDLTPRVVAPVRPPRAWVRAVRAIGILEGLATPDAHRLLEAIAHGEAGALPTAEARAAIARLGKK